MPDYIVFMHGDATDDPLASDWDAYIAKLSARGAFRGGSAIGPGQCLRSTGPAAEVTSQIAGYIRIEASGWDQAKTLMDGNPVLEAGGTVEIRELPKTD